MKKYLLILILLVSCNGTQKKDIEASSSQEVMAKDTLITYNLEDLSPEGASADVLYKNRKISESAIVLYGGSGKKEIEYIFEEDKIKVTEKSFVYSTEIENVKSDEDIQLTNEQTYDMDYNGNVIGKPVEDRSDIFSEFKTQIPFIIK